MDLQPGWQLADQRVTEWFLREQGLREQERASAIPPIHTVVTISRQFGAGGHIVAEKVAAKLGTPWQVWDREIIDAIALDAQVRSSMVETVDERSRSLGEKVAADLAGDPVLHHDAYYRHLVKVLLDAGHAGYKIVVGRAAYLVLGESLKVRLRAAPEFRAENVAQREGISRDAALGRLQKVDHDRATLVQTYFERDVENPGDYDMSLQTDRLGYEAAADAIVAALCSRMLTDSARHDWSPVSAQENDGRH